MSTKTEYFCLEPSKFRLDGGAMFGIIPKPLWNKVAPADEENRIDMSLRLLLKKTEQKLILVDTGIGEYRDETFNTRFDVRSEAAPLVHSLNEVGISREQVTDVIISHLHFDHVGGLGEIINGEFSPIFKKATLHLHREHYKYSLNPTERDSGSFRTEEFKPLIEYYQKNNQLHWIEGEEGIILDKNSGDMKFKCSHGHTPFLAHPYDDKYIYLADLVPMSCHIPIPWVMGYDIMPGVSTENKKEFYEFIIKNNLTCIFEHDPKFWGATLTTDSKGRTVIKEKFESRLGFFELL